MVVVPHGRELIFGIYITDLFGALVVFGLRSTETDLFGDRAAPQPHL